MKNAEIFVKLMACESLKLFQKIRAILLLLRRDQNSFVAFKSKLESVFKS